MNIQFFQHHAMVRRLFRPAITLSSITGSLILSLTGCAIANQAYQPAPVPAPYHQPLPQMLSAPRQEAAPTDGSIFSASRSADLFSDDKAFRRGDLLLVRVIQNSSGTKKANTDTKRNLSISAKIKYLLGLEEPINDLTDYTNENADGTKSEWNPNDLISAESQSQFKGEGATARTDALQATVSTVVTDVLQNGNLVIYGHQTVTLNNEASVLTVQGIVRPSDVSDQNIIDSTRIAQADIQFTGSGVITDKQHPGWAVRIFDTLWPF